MKVTLKNLLNLFISLALLCTVSLAQAEIAPTNSNDQQANATPWQQK